MFRQRINWRHFVGAADDPMERPRYEEDLDYIASSTAAVLQQSPRGGQALLWAVLCFFAAALIWAGNAEVDEFTRGEGRVIPSQKLQVIQNLEGGIVQEIFVREGQLVERGQPLLRIDDTLFNSTLMETDVTLDQLTARVARLEAEAAGEDFAPGDMPEVDPQFIAQELALYSSRKLERKTSEQVFREQANQKQQELNELKAKVAQLQRSYKLLESELELTRPLVSEGAVSEVEMLRLERQANDLLGDLEAAQLGIPRAESGLEEVREKLAASQLAFQSEVQKELAEARAELSRQTQSSKAAEDRVKRTLVRSPVAGTVKQMLVDTIGGVIRPGMDIVEVVPNEDKLLVEARVRPSDIAFITPGQQANVKVTAYDFAIHGGLIGQVVQISPDTIVDEEGESFYLVQVETEKAFLGSEARPLPIIPGMVVSVDILTGEKTVLDYLLKPILKTKQLALRER
ncbi:HlyD family type I secretion periplasmic adaptor subunit [Simiduia agarivorans]|uniref:Membrane fusion protein (MFP) family protein n=1 Tax=Simiduia agarivorans (strain DSM 21679 / JCM 13881 / BCRC 17597 / SA1) TaxID=1117647 RepID=K4KPP6_SIMAS|nr:HlyD family type I secretion periplasmic adaptor subunit [Simiduia agarivorans]AFV01027.1 HlyD family secretion protein [Simiduia agarivorans SA1 = DSM 21679]